MPEETEGGGQCDGQKPSAGCSSRDGVCDDDTCWSAEKVKSAGSLDSAYRFYPNELFALKQEADKRLDLKTHTCDYYGGGATFWPQEVR